MYEILPYSPELDQRFDLFVKKESFNGTFLQTRRFLNYHPADRFVDASFALQKSGIIVAYFPGVVKDGVFVSHAGSTFGGPIIAKQYYRGSRLGEVLTEADQYLASHFKSVRLKITSSIFCEENPDLLEYILEHLGYSRHTELSCYTPLSKDVDPLENCTGQCRRNFRQAEKLDLTYGEIPDGELEKFYECLTLSKARHHTTPVHSLAELRDIKRRFPKEIMFRGVWQNDENGQGRVYLSGMMNFYFKNANVLHFQYLAPDDSRRDTNASTAMLIYSMREAIKAGIEKFSWGISTEDGGSYLNENLYHFKESFGALPCVNVRYEKSF